MSVLHYGIALDGCKVKFSSLGFRACLNNFSINIYRIKKEIRGLYTNSVKNFTPSSNHNSP